jgi:hypothetical protein
MRNPLDEMIRKRTRHLLKEGFLSLRYCDGKAVYTPVPELLATTEADRDTVNEAFKAAGPDGATCREIAEKTGLPLIVVRHWTPDVDGCYADGDDTLRIAHDDDA